jgi:hypothetical protein
MQFQEGSGFPGAASPIARLPGKLIMADDFARSGDILRLEMRSRVGDFQLAIDPELVNRARARTANFALIPAVAARLHGMRALEHQLHTFGGGSPKPESHAVSMQLWPEDCRGVHCEPE